MRTITPTLQAHLDTGATTLCHCWKLTRRDGVVFGFTDHDRPLSFDGLSFQPEAGVTGARLDLAAGLAVDNAAISGALSADFLTETDLSAGRYDGAAIELYRVNWSAVAQRLLLKSGTLGEVTRGRLGFEAEVRGVSHRFDETVGRIFQRGCDADLGDGRCGVDIDVPTYKGTGAVLAAADRMNFSASGLSAFASGWFSLGRLVWTNGANTGLRAAIKAHAVNGAAAEIELWRPAPAEISATDEFEIFAGCDKKLDTCRDKFGNGVSFRGFPFIPGDDFVTGYPLKGENNDGGRREG